MTQISKGDTFADTQQLTAARLNQLVDSAQILVGAISEQPSITANTLESTDTTLVNDSGVLKKTTIGDILNSGIGVTTNTVTSSANNDITLNPSDGTAVLGSNYVSGDGLTVTVTTLAPHGLAINNVVLISGAGTGYNGTFRITAVTSTTFQYVLYTAATATGSPTACTYVRKATAIVNGSEVVSGNLYVAGEVESQTLQVNGTAEVNTLATRTANVTTALQFSGTPVSALVSVTEVTIPFAQCDGTTAAQVTATCNQWRTVTSISAASKTNKEIWVIEVDAPFLAWQRDASLFRITRNSTSEVLAMQYYWLNSLGCYTYSAVKMTCVIPESVTFTTADSFNFQFRYNCPTAFASSILNVGYGGAMTDSTVTRVMRITKYLRP